MFKCNLCDDKFVHQEDLIAHLDDEHSDDIPKDFTAAQYYYSLKTGKTSGSCVVCKMPTHWNESTQKYCRFCEMKKCKDTYKEEFRKRMIGKHGKIHLLNDPDQQKKMLANRSISGKYKWSDGTEIGYTGSYELDFLQFLDLFMNFSSEDIMSPSPHVYYYTYKGEEKFYIPDLFIPSLNLEIEIKDGGDNPNNHHKIQDVDKVKEKLKDEVLMGQTTFSYIKLVNKGYGPFFDFLAKAKKEFAENGENAKPIFIVEEPGFTNDSANAKPLPPIKSQKNKEDNINPPSKTIPLKESADSTNQLHPVFILMTYTDTSMAKLIRMVTKDPYSHASISFDSSLSDVYSFGRKHKDDPMKFINEDINEGVFKDVSEVAEYSLYVTFVDKDQLKLMHQRLDYFKKNKGKLSFGFVGLFNIAIGRETDRQNEYFCSQFVAEVLKAGVPDALDRDTSMYTPYGLKDISNVKYVTRGKLRNYDSKVIDRKVEQLKKKITLHVQESSEVVTELFGFGNNSEKQKAKGIVKEFIHESNDEFMMGILNGGEHLSSYHNKLIKFANKHSNDKFVLEEIHSMIKGERVYCTRYKDKAKYADHHIDFINKKFEPDLMKHFAKL